MHTITLVSTIHQETGLCNSLELLKILNEIKPEVIFEELLSSVYEECYTDYSFTTLETNAVKLYIQENPKIKIDHLPVDTYIRPKPYYSGNNKLLNELSKNIDYRTLLDKDYNNIINEGFSYLNSSKSISLFDKLDLLIHKILSEKNDSKLQDMYDLWKETDTKRELEIIKNIYSYSYEHKYEQGVLFMGSGHRKSITEKINEFEKRLDFHIIWHFYNFKYDKD